MSKKFPKFLANHNQMQKTKNRPKIEQKQIKNRLKQTNNRPKIDQKQTKN